MKFFFQLTLTLLCLFSGLSLFASPSECNTSTSDPAQFLKNCAGGTTGIQPGPAGRAGVRDRVKIIAERAIAFGGILAVGAIIWAGIQYTTAYGDDEKHKHAKTTAIYAGIGLILLMAGFGLVDIFLNFIGMIATAG